MTTLDGVTESIFAAQTSVNLCSPSFCRVP
jgi:hypothetical protein